MAAKIIFDSIEIRKCTKRNTKRFYYENNIMTEPTLCFGWKVIQGSRKQQWKQGKLELMIQNPAQKNSWFAAALLPISPVWLLNTTIVFTLVGRRCCCLPIRMSRDTAGLPPPPAVPQVASGGKKIAHHHIASSYDTWFSLLDLQVRVRSWIRHYTRLKLALGVSAVEAVGLESVTGTGKG